MSIVSSVLETLLSLLIIPSNDYELCDSTLGVARFSF